MLLFKTISLDLLLVQLHFLTIAPFCCPDSAGYIPSFSSNMDLIIISSVVLLSFCEFVFLTHEDGLFPRRLNVSPGCFVFYSQPSCFHFTFFAFRNCCADSKGTKMHIFFSENSMHGNHVNIFLVTFILLSRWLFFKYKWDWVGWT